MISHSSSLIPANTQHQLSPLLTTHNNRPFQETTETFPQFLSIDKICERLIRMGIVDETGKIIESQLLQRHLPESSEAQLNQFKSFFNQEIEIPCSKGLPFLKLFSFFANEAETFKYEIPDIVITGWGGFYLLEKWGYLDEAIAEIDTEILQLYKASLPNPPLSHPIEMLVNINGYDLIFIKKGLMYQFQEWQLKHPQLPNFGNENVSISFDRFWTGQNFLPCLFIPLRIQNGQLLNVRIISHGKERQLIIPYPLGISLRRISEEKILSHALLCKSDHFWQVVVDYLIGTQNISPQQFHDNWMLQLRNISKGFRPPRLLSSLELYPVINKLDASFSEVAPEDSNEIFITAFQLCLNTPQEDRANKKIWSYAREYAKKKYRSDHSMGLSELFFLIAKLIIDEKVPFEYILSVFQFVGYIHLHTKNASGEEDHKLNFRLTRCNQSLAFRVSFKSPLGDKSYLFFHCHPYESPKKTLREESEKKLILLLDKLLPSTPIDFNCFIAAEPWLSQMSFRSDFTSQETSSHSKLCLEHHFNMYVKCFAVLRNEKLTYLNCMFDYLERIFCSPLSGSSRKFIICSLDMKISQLYGSAKFLEKGLKKYLDKTFSKTEFWQILFAAISKGEDPLLLTSYKNFWRKRFVSGSQMDKTFWDVGHHLSSILIDKNCVLEAQSLIDFLYKQKKLSATEALNLLSRLCEKGKRIPQSNEQVSCYSQIGSLILRIFEESPSLNKNPSVDFSSEAFNWLLLQLLESQMELVVDILTCAADKNMKINGTSLFDMLKVWKTDEDFLLHLPALNKQFLDLHLAVGDRLAEACNTSTTSHPLSLEEMIDTQLQTSFPYSIKTLRFLFKTLAELQQPSQDNLKLKIVQALIKNFLGNQLLSGRHCVEMQTLYRENALSLFIHLQKGNLIKDMANLFLKLVNEITWKDPSFEGYALWCIERLLELQSESSSILLAHDLMKLVLAITTSTPVTDKARILCMLSNSLFEIDRSLSLSYALQLASVPLEVLWDKNAVSDIMLCSRHCAAIFLNISTASQLVKILIKADGQIEKLAEFWLGIYQSIKDGPHLFQCIETLIEAKTLFQKSDQFSRFTDHAQQLSRSLSNDNEIEEAALSKLIELLKSYAIFDGDVWHIAIQCAIKSKKGTKRYVLNEWLKLDLLNQINYSHPQEATAHKVEVERVARPSRPGPGQDALVTLPQEREHCWKACLNNLKIFSKSEIMLLFNQRDHLRKIFFEPKTAFMMTLKEVLRILLKTDLNPIEKSLLLEIATFRDACLKHPQTFNSEIDIPLGQLLASRDDPELHSKSLELYEKVLVANGTQIYSSSICAAFLDFFRILTKQDVQDFHDKIISITTHLREHATKFLIHFEYAEQLIKIGSKNAYHECAEMALAGLKQQESKKSTLPSGDRLYALMDVLVANVTNGVNPDTLNSCLKHEQFVALIPLRISHPLWYKFVANMLQTTLDDPESTQEELFRWCSFALSNVRKILFDPFFFRNCFELIIKSKLIFLEKYKDLARFKTLHSLSINMLQINDNNMNAVTIQIAEVAFAPIILRIVQEYLHAIDEKRITDPSHIDQLYLSAWAFMSGSHLLFGTKHMTKLFQATLVFFCNWNVPIYSPSTQCHLITTLTLCVKYMKMGLSEQYPEAARQIIHSVVKKYIDFRKSHPDEIQKGIESSGYILEIIGNLFNSHLIDKAILKEWIVQIIHLAPTVTNPDSSQENRLKALRILLNLALTEQILDSDTCNALQASLSISSQSQ